MSNAIPPVYTLGRSPTDGRSKASSWLALETGANLCSITVWDTGEAELDQAELASAQVHSEHRDLQTHADLNDALAILVVWLRRPPG
ncbi:hypothetical protein [Streptomyces sp. NPDC050485]|uniref:hypothetical protein n=1 Tax=Streptomyces sp. NPDC050485 TaxID=3365617 RepID=UPI0037BAB6F8